MSHVFNGFIDVSSKLDALALFFARLLSGSLQYKIQRAVFGVSVEFRARVSRKRGLNETRENVGFVCRKFVAP